MQHITLPRHLVSGLFRSLHLCLDQFNALPSGSAKAQILAASDTVLVRLHAAVRKHDAGRAENLRRDGVSRNLLHRAARAMECADERDLDALPRTGRPALAVALAHWRPGVTARTVLFERGVL